MKAYYIDSENINNFSIYPDLLKDIEDDDVVYVFYTTQHQRNCVERTLNISDTVRISYLHCSAEKEPLDQKIKKVILDHYARYRKHIIISSDTDFTGFIMWGFGTDIIGPLRKCERRGVQGDLRFRI